MEGFVVVRKIPGTQTNDYELLIPGHMSKSDAHRAKAAYNRSGIPCEVWENTQWSIEQDRIAQDVFCPECDEERELCTCEQDRQNDCEDLDGPPYRDSWARANNQ